MLPLSRTAYRRRDARRHRAARDVSERGGRSQPADVATSGTPVDASRRAARGVKTGNRLSVRALNSGVGTDPRSTHGEGDAGNDPNGAVGRRFDRDGPWLAVVGVDGSRQTALRHAQSRGQAGDRLRGAQVAATLDQARVGDSDAQSVLVGGFGPESLVEYRGKATRVLGAGQTGHQAFRRIDGDGKQVAASADQGS